MKASQLKRALLHMVPLRLPLFIWGPPGLGKSQILLKLSLLSADFLRKRAQFYAWGFMCCKKLVADSCY